MVKVLGSRVVGPLELHAADFATDLYRQGYTANGASQHICLVAHLSRWMAGKGLGVAALTPRLTEKMLKVVVSLDIEIAGLHVRCSLCSITSGP
jgi:hypothetical protein